MGDAHDPQYQPDDDWLLSADLEIGDPRNMFDLVDTIPEDAEIEEMVAAYHYHAEKLRCAKCNRAIHNRGYVVRFTGSKHVLLGKDCGHLYFPGSFEAHLANHDQQVRRQKYLRLVAPTDRAISEALDALQSWGPPTHALANLRRGFQRHHRDLYDRLAAAMRESNGELLVPKSRKVSKSELGSAAAQVNEMKQMLRPGGSGRVSEYETTHESQGFMVGGELFLTLRDPRATIREVAEDLRVAQKKLRSPKLSTGDLGRLLREVREVVDRLIEARTRYIAARRFLERPNLVRVVTWASQHPHLPGKYRLTKRELVLDNDWGDDVRWAYEMELPDIGTEPIDALRVYQETRSVA